MLQGSLEVRTLACDLDNLGLNLGPAINSHPGVSHARKGVDMCAVPRIDVKLGVPSASLKVVDVKDHRVSFVKSR